MKQFFFFLLTIAAIPHLQSQVIRNGIVYGKNAYQRCQQSYTSPSGSRYSTITFTDDGFQGNAIIDSAGVPIVIKRPSIYQNYTHAILKYDSNGRFIHYIHLASSSLGTYGEELKLCFDAQDNMYLYFFLDKRDTINLYHADKRFFKQLIMSKADSALWSNKDVNQDVSILAKLNASGEFQWVTYVENKSPYHYSSSFQFKYLWDWSQRFFTNSNHELIVQYDNSRLGYTHEHDTLLLTDPEGSKRNLPVSTRDVVLRFSTDGKLINYHEPFKGRLSRIVADTAPEGFYRSVTDGINTYSIYRFHAGSPDTFRCNTPVALFPGLNYVLFKTNAQDEIVWAKHIGLDQYTYPHHHFHIDYSKHRKQLLLGFAYTPAVFSFTHNPGLDRFSYYTDLYVSTYDTSGNVLWEKTYSGTAHETMVSLTYNHKTNQLTMIGTSESDDFVLGKYVLQANNGTQGKPYVAVIDSMNEIYSAQLIRAPSAFMMSTDIGYPVTDHKGRTYITGWFYDSIQLACNNTLNATHWLDKYDRETPDGFVLIMEPYTLIDTGVCYNMRSPSNKYGWDSSAVYYDTIPDVTGCDSVLVFRLKVLNSKSSIDTAVCKQLKSMSGKYLWDSTGTYRDTIMNVYGCDSVITVKLTLLNSTSSFDSTVNVFMRSPSGRYRWDSTATYYDTIPNARGCDSVIAINLHVLQTQNEIDTAVCRTMLSPSGRYVYSLPGIYTDTITNTAGGDSIMTIKVRLLHTQSSMDTATCAIFTSPSGKYSWDVTGTYYDTLINEKGCDSIISIRLRVIPLVVSISKSNDISCGITHAQLIVTGGSRYAWSPSNGLSDIAVANPYANPDTTTLYHVLVNDSLGCSASDSIELVVSEKPDVNELPNVFTPNDDGLNDCLHLNAVTEFRQVEWLIYNRWGTEVFHTRNANDCWNGKDAAGNELNAGVYFFLLHGTGSCDEKIKQHGTITLIR